MICSSSDPVLESYSAHSQRRRSKLIRVLVNLMRFLMAWKVGQWEGAWGRGGGLLKGGGRVQGGVGVWGCGRGPPPRRRP